MIMYLVLQDILQRWQLAQTTEFPCSPAGQILDQAANRQHDTRGAEEGECPSIPAILTHRCYH